MTRINEIDRKVLGALSAADRIKALLREAGYETTRDFAKETGLYVAEISMCLNQRREYPRIRDALAEKLGLTREQIDELIPWPPEPAETEVVSTGM